MIPGRLTVFLFLAGLVTVTAVRVPRVRHARIPDERATTLTRPNIVFILTDDQDVVLGGGFNHMDQTRELLLNAGKQVQNAFVSTPVCCPSRSSIVTGRYIHNTKTYNNSVAGGCASPGWRAGAEQDSLGVQMQRVGYKTAYMGKYLNQYGEPGSGTGVEHVPPGWTNWLGLVGNSRYYNYTLSNNGVAEQHGDDYNNDYLTDVLARRGVEFIEKYASSDTPFFLTVATPATHRPDTPAPQYANDFRDVQAPRTPTFNVTAKDKHWLLSRATPPLDATAIAGIDNLYRHRLRTLQSVDDLVASVVQTLDALNILDNTYLVYTSDHGYHLGQNNQHGEKRQPYDTNTRVPFAIRGPGVVPGSVSDAMISSIDIVPTIVDLAGGAPDPMNDGVSAKSALVSDTLPSRDDKEHPDMMLITPQRTEMLIEYFGETNNNAECPGCYCDHGTPGVDAGFFIHDCHNNTFACIRAMTNELFCNFYVDDNPAMTDIQLSEYYSNASNTVTNEYPSLSPADVTQWQQRIAVLRDCHGSTCQVDTARQQQ